MIILDTSILRTFSPESSSADLLRVIRTLDAEQVAVPWMVMEELTAQQAIKYRDKFEKASQAVEALQQVTPWPLDVPLGECALADVRAHWRTQWRSVVGEVPTSENALRQAAFREANNLAPCKILKDAKTGARDAAIWLSAVEYGREHPDEIVYFVSANTNDFGTGQTYPSPMREDLIGLEGRFVHLTSMDDVAARFAEPTTVNEEYAFALLGSAMFTDEVVHASNTTFQLPIDGSFSCTIATGLADERVVVPALAWSTTKAAFGSVENMKSYRIGDHTWCTATVRWNLGGTMLTDARPDGTAWGACSWTTSVLFTPRGAESRLTILRADATPIPLGGAEFDALNLPLSELTPDEYATATITRIAGPSLSSWPGPKESTAHMGVRRYGRPRDRYGWAIRRRADPYWKERALLGGVAAHARVPISRLGFSHHVICPHCAGARREVVEGRRARPSRGAGPAVGDLREVGVGQPDWTQDRGFSSYRAAPGDRPVPSWRAGQFFGRSAQR